MAQSRSVDELIDCFVDVERSAENNRNAETAWNRISEAISTFTEQVVHTAAASFEAPPAEQHAQQNGDARFRELMRAEMTEAFADDLNALRKNDENFGNDLEDVKYLVDCLEGAGSFYSAPERRAFEEQFLSTLEWRKQSS